MAEKKRPESLNSSASKSNAVSLNQANSSLNDANSQSADVQPPTDGAKHGRLAGHDVEAVQGGQGMNARILYHQPASAMKGAPHVQQDFAPLRAASGVQRQDRADDEPSPRAKIFDPVKDCNYPNAIQAHLPGFISARHDGNKQFMDSTVSGVASKDLHFCHGDRPYGQAEDNRQQVTNSETGLFLYSQPHAMALGYQDSASMGQHRYLQQNALVSGFQENASQPFQAGHPYDRFQHSLQHQSGYGKNTILPPHLERPSGQNRPQSFEPRPKGAASMGIHPHQIGYFKKYSQGDGQQLMSMKSRTPGSMGSHESARPRLSSPSTSSEIISEWRSGLQQEASRLQRQRPSVSASQALSTARSAETWEQQSSYSEAMRAYEQACALLQDVIIKGCSIGERRKCNDAWNSCQVRLNVLTRKSAAILSNSPAEQDDQQEDDDAGTRKPQYSLFEDWMLCRKEEEDLSWQDVAETPMFNGKRKNRSLSQRKHTISKMGPKYCEAENPWTEDEDRRLCALGDAGKTLGEVHRKFPSRNAVRCLNRYFGILKGHHIPGRSHTHTSHQAHQDPALWPLTTRHTHSSSVLTRHRGQRLHPSASVISPVSQRQSIGTVLQQNRQVSPVSGQSIPSASTPTLQALGMPSWSSSLSSAGAPIYTRARSTSHSGAEAPNHATHFPSFEHPSSPKAVGDGNTGWLFSSRRPKPAPLSSSSYASTVNSPTFSEPPTSALTSPEMMPTPLDTRSSSDSHGAAPKRLRKPR